MSQEHLREKPAAARMGVDDARRYEQKRFESRARMRRHDQAEKELKSKRRWRLHTHSITRMEDLLGVIAEG